MMTGTDGWRWKEGVAYNTVHYTREPEAPAGLLSWMEEIAPEDDDRGNGSRSEIIQPMADFLRTGPHRFPPVEIVEAILARIAPVVPDWFPPYRLQKAVSEQNVAGVEELLRQGVQADMPVRGVTSIYRAITLRNLLLAERLFAAGIDVDRHFSGMDETLLMLLAMYAPDASWASLAQRMVAQSVELEAQNRYGETALMTAASSGYQIPELVGILLAAGADVNARSLHGYTPLWKAASRRYVPAAIIQQLIDAGADVNACDKEGNSVLMVAISNALVEGVRCLIAAGADVQATSTPRRTSEKSKSVLQVAQDYANPEIIRQIEEAGGK